jgi:hypothetical protein
MDVGVFRSADRGASWSRFGTGLPAVSVHDLEISEDGSLARIATHGRGVWELEIPPPGNRPPLVTLLSPGASIRITAGETVEFAGRLSDEDAGDDVAGTWTFPDTWETVRIGRGETTISHTFRRAGIFPVSLTAVDRSGATASSFVTVTVPEAADDCARPLSLPGAGPFPATLLVNNESATPQPGDPVPGCLFEEGVGVFGSVWLEFTPASTDFYEVSTCGTMADTVLTAFTGPACGALEVVANGCNDDTPRTDETACARTSSLLTLFVEAGQTVRLQLTGYLPAEVSTIPVTVRLSSGRGAPQVTGITRRACPENGGTEVLLTGTGFGEGARARFGGVEATALQRIGPTLVSVVAPPHAAGPVEISVENPDGSSGRLLGAFTYLRSAAPRNLCPDGSDCPSRPRTHAVPPRR